MSEKLRTLTLQIDDKPVALTVVRATAEIGIERYLIGSRGLKQNDEEKNIPEARKILRITLYPDLVSCTVPETNIPWPPSFDEFRQMPESVINEWAEAVYAVNPHWRIIDETADKAKNAKPRRSSKKDS